MSEMEPAVSEGNGTYWESLGAASLLTAVSAGEPATNLSNICGETVCKRLGIQPGCALTFGHCLGEDFADELGDGHTAFSGHGIEGDGHGAVDAYGQVALTAFGRLLLGEVRDVWSVSFSSHGIALRLCRECGAGSVLGTPVAATGRADEEGEPP